MDQAWRSSAKGWDRPETPGRRTGRGWQTSCYACPLALEVTKNPWIVFSSCFPKPPLPWTHIYSGRYLSGFLKLGCLEDPDPWLNSRNISMPNTESTSNLTPGHSVPSHGGRGRKHSRGSLLISGSTPREFSQVLILKGIKMVFLFLDDFLSMLSWEGVIGWYSWHHIHQTRFGRFFLASRIHTSTSCWVASVMSDSLWAYGL